MNSIYIDFTSFNHSHKAPVPSDHLDVAVVTRSKNDINTVRFLTQTARFVCELTSH